MTDTDNEESNGDSNPEERRPETVELRVNSSIHKHTAGRPKLTVYPPWVGLISVSDKYLGEGYAEVAVIVAMTACETIVARALTRAYCSKGVPELEAPIDDLLSSCAIATNSRVRKLYEALTGDKQINQQPFWNDLVEATKTRNRIVHRGGRVGKAVARRYVDAVKQTVEYVQTINNLPQ